MKKITHVQGTDYNECVAFGADRVNLNVVS